MSKSKMCKNFKTVFGVIGSGNAPTSISKLMTAHKSNYNLCGDAILKLPRVNSTKSKVKVNVMEMPGCATMEHHSK